MYWLLTFIADENKSKSKPRVLNKPDASLAWWVPYFSSSCIPTFGAGIRFEGYGFDFGYTAGPDTHPRTNSLFFSISAEI